MLCYNISYETNVDNVCYKACYVIKWVMLPMLIMSAMEYAMLLYEYYVVIVNHICYGACYVIKWVSCSQCWSCLPFIFCLITMFAHMNDSRAMLTLLPSNPSAYSQLTSNSIIITCSQWGPSHENAFSEKAHRSSTCYWAAMYIVRVQWWKWIILATLCSWIWNRTMAGSLWKYGNRIRFTLTKQHLKIL